MIAEKIIPLLGAALAAVLSFVAYWSSPAFAPLIGLTLLSLPLAAYSASEGAPKTAVVGAYFGVAAWLPFWVPRDSIFKYEVGYLALLPGGLLLCLVLIIRHRRNSSDAKQW